MDAQRYVVGYVADERGYEALDFACAMAARARATLVVTTVIHGVTSYTGSHSTPFAKDPILHQQLGDWEQEALARIPAELAARFEVRTASSEVHGLIEAAEEHRASLLVIGARANILADRFTIGSVANALLHASPVPVALAPSGHVGTTPIKRVTALISTRPGAQSAVGAAVDAAARRGIRLRLISLVATSDDDAADELVDHARQAGGEQLAAVAQHLIDSSQVSIEVVTGGDLDDAIDHVEWIDGDVAIVGSSRLAQRGRVFLATTARRVLRRTRVPLIVTPRGPK